MLDLEIEVMKISCFCKMEICLCVCDMFINCVCGMSCCQIVLLSCLCFVEMSIYFRFGEFRANSRSIYVLFLGKVMPNFCMTLMHDVYYYRADIHDGQWNDGGQVVAVGGAGDERK